MNGVARPLRRSGAKRAPKARTPPSAPSALERALHESRELLRIFIEYSPMALAIFDREMRYLHASRRWRQDYQLGRRALRGRSHYAIFPEIPPRWKMVHRRALRGEVVRQEEDRFEREDGSVQWMRWEARPWRTAQGDIGGILIFSEDITDRKRSEEALRASEIRYRDLVQGLPAAVYICDREGRLVLYNAEAVKLWGREPDVERDRWCGARRVLDLEGRCVDFSELAIARAVRCNQSLRGAERIIERPDGTRAHVLSYPDPIHDAQGRVIGAVNMLVDITALKQTENALRTSERKLRTLSRAIEQSPASVVITNLRGEIEYVNPRFTAITGYSQTEVIGQNPRILKSHHQSDEFYRKLWTTIHAGLTWRGEFCNRRKDGSEFWESAVIAPIHDQDGTITHFVAIKEDITEKRRAVEALQDREEKLRAILNTVHDAIITIDLRGIIVGVNRATLNMFGYAEEELVGKNVKVLMPQPYARAHDAHLANYDRTRQARVIGIGREAQGRRKDGTLFPIELAIGEVEKQNLYTGVVRDITLRCRLEAEVLQIGEEERLRVAADLHDGICQELMATSFVASAVARDLAPTDPGSAAKVRELAGAISQITGHTRAVARGMIPVIAEGDGLMLALRQLARHVRQNHLVHCTFACPRPVLLDNTVTANQLYRIAQEAVHNTLRHADASRLTLRLTDTAECLCLCICDNGRGLPEPPLSPRGEGPSQPVPGAPSVSEGIGVRTMQYRARLLGGHLHVRARRRGGTEVVCRLPKNSGEAAH